MAQITNTVLSVNPAGQIVTKVSFNNDNVISWYDNNYGDYDVLVTVGTGIHQTSTHRADTSMDGINSYIAIQLAKS